MKKIILIYFGLMLITGYGENYAVQEKCALSPVEYNGYQALKLDNGLISAVAIPHVNGNVCSLHFNAPETEFFLPLEIVVCEIVPGLGLYYISETNGGGWEDLIWGRQFQTRHREYTVKTRQVTAQAATLSLSWENSVIRIVRDMQAEAGSTLLKVKVDFTNKSSENKKIAYWSHPAVLPGGRVTLQDPQKTVLCAPTRATDRPLRERGLVLKKDQLLVRGINKGSIYLPPAQNWWAYVNREDQLALVQLFDQAALQPDGLLYSYGNEQLTGADPTPNYATMEIVYPETDYAPNETRSFHICFGLARGVKSVHAAGTWGALDCSGAAVRYVPFSGKSPVKLQLTCQGNVAVLLFDNNRPGESREPAKTEGTLSLPQIRTEGAEGLWLDSGWNEKGKFMILPEETK